MGITVTRWGPATPHRSRLHCVHSVRSQMARNKSGPNSSRWLISLGVAIDLSPRVDLNFAGWSGNRFNNREPQSILSGITPSYKASPRRNAGRTSRAGENGRARTACSDGSPVSQISGKMDRWHRIYILQHNPERSHCRSCCAAGENTCNA